MPLDNELFTALKMFSQGVTDLSVSRTLSAANDEVAQIKASEANEQQKRAALQDLSNSLVRQLGAAGVEPTRIAQQAQSISPIFANPAQAATQGALVGDQSMVEAAKQADIAGQTGNIEQLKVQQKGAEKLQNIKFAQAMALQNAKGQKQSNPDVEFTSNVQSALVNLQKLEKTVKKYGNAEVMNTDAASVLNQAAYDLAIAYAKIVDPASVAREGEVAAAQRYMLQMGWGTRNSRTLSDIKQFRNKIQERVKARQLAKRTGKVDIFDQHLGGGGISQSTSSGDGNDSGDDLSAFIMGN